jgi:Cof subfamily protein (haloacid dehalogenase superfamily)
MIVVDMDGTLLKDNKEVSEVNKEAIKKARESGVRLVICTGRIFTSAKAYAKLLGAMSPIIASNGAYIREKDKEEVIFEKILDKDKLLKSIEMIKSYGLVPHIYTTNTIYTEKLIHSSKNYATWNEGLDEIDRVIIEIVDDLSEVINDGKRKFIKAVVMSEDLEKLKELKNKIQNEVDVEIMSSTFNNFEITAKGTSKGNGVKILAEFYGIKKDEIICIGDNENDISMIKYAGLGVAMANSSEEVKKIAKYVTESNENDGVAKVIDKYILASK